MIANAWKRENPEKHRDHNREWRARNPDKVVAYNESRRVPPTKLKCVECGAEFEGRSDRLICSRRCKDRRFARLHPDKLKAKERRHQAQRRARTRESRP